MDLVRTIMSHGVADLPPGHVDEETRAYTTTLALPSAQPRTIRIADARIEVEGPELSAKAADDLTAAVRQILNLDEDLSEFHALVANDSDLSWACRGAGRMLRAPTVLEDVVKTICTTNCAWGGTVRMTTALVTELGPEAPGGRRAFPSPTVDGRDGRVVLQRCRTRRLSRAVPPLLCLRGRRRDDGAGGARDPELPDGEVAGRLLALPGVGPYAAAHVMTTALGRYSRLILDSWTRPTYMRLVGAKRKLADKTIERRFKRYGQYAGLAFCFYLTRDWVPEED